MPITHRTFVARAFDEVLQAHQLPKGKVLDVGCYTHEFFEESFKEQGYEWHGVDLKVRTEHPNFKQGSMWEIPWPDNTFDLLFVSHAFEHSIRPICSLREFQRVLKRDGYLFIANPPPCQRHITDGDADHLFVLHEDQLAKIFTYLDFEDVSIWRYPGNVPNNDTVCVLAKNP